FYKIEDEKAFVESKIQQSSRRKTRHPQGVRIKGIDNIKIRFSKCCNPVPGDEIVGYITRGRGVSVHRTDCPNIIVSDDAERFIEVEWDLEKKVAYHAEIQIKATDRAGLLADITQRITEADLGVVS